jgi:malate permease and related proteins
MLVFSTIIPIFAVVILGFMARKKGFMPPAFLDPANRIVYYLAIPALIFRSVSKASFLTEFNVTVLLVTLSAALMAYLGAWIIGRFTRWPPARIGTFIQCSAHGNLGYIGIPVAFYFIGQSGLAKASILAGFLMIMQNTLSVLALQAHSVEEADTGKKIRDVAQKLIHNPIIMSAAAGMLVSLFQIPLPGVFQRFLDILSGLAPPMSLLLIGAALSLQVMRKNLLSVLGSVAIKVLMLPVTGLILFLMLDVRVEEYLPGLILLATPTATVAYVMAKEMHGDDQFAVAAISTSTIVSAFTYLIWLTMVNGG